MKADAKQKKKRVIQKEKKEESEEKRKLRRGKAGKREVEVRVFGTKREG